MIPACGFQQAGLGLGVPSFRVNREDEGEGKWEGQSRGARTGFPPVVFLLVGKNENDIECNWSC